MVHDVEIAPKNINCIEVRCKTKAMQQILFRQLQQREVPVKMDEEGLLIILDDTHYEYMAVIMVSGMCLCNGWSLLPVGSF